MSIHWSLEIVYLADVDTLDMEYQPSICVDAEVPMDGERRLPRHGNRWYPSLVKIEGPDYVLLTADQARAYAAQLIAAADAADAVDKPDIDTCGHWAPCDCEQKKAS